MLFDRELEREAELKEQARIAEEKRKEEEEYQRMKAEFAVVEGGSVVDDMANEVCSLIITELGGINSIIDSLLQSQSMLQEFVDFVKVHQIHMQARACVR